MGYTRNIIRYISNAGGWDGEFFPCLLTPPFLNQQIPSNRFSSPPDLNLGFGTEETTLLRPKRKNDAIYLTLTDIGSAAPSLLNKVCLSILSILLNYVA